MSEELKCNISTSGLPVIKPLERFRNGYSLWRPRHPTTMESDLRVANLGQCSLCVAFGMDKDSEVFQKFKKTLSDSAKNSFSGDKSAMVQPLKNWERYKKTFTKALENSWIISEDAIPWLNGFAARSIAGRRNVGRRAILGTRESYSPSPRNMASASTSSESKPVPALLHAQTISGVQRRPRTRLHSQTLQAAFVELEVPPRRTPEVLTNQQNHENEVIVQDGDEPRQNLASQAAVVLEFLQSLNPPMDHLQRILLDLGINTEARLKAISKWPKHRLIRWIDEWAYEYGHRVEPFELEVIAEALRNDENIN